MYPVRCSVAVSSGNGHYYVGASRDLDHNIQFFNFDIDISTILNQYKENSVMDFNIL